MNEPRTLPPSRQVGGSRNLVQRVARRLRRDGKRVANWCSGVCQNPTRASNPAFVVGCGRSGTTMLLRQLGESKHVEIWNEDHPDVFEKWRLRDMQCIDAAMRKSWAPVCLFKPILNTHQTRQLLTRFAEGRIVFCFRHVDDVANSSLRKFGENHHLKTMERWLENDFAEFHQARSVITEEFVRARYSTSLSPASASALVWLFYNRLWFDLQLESEERAALVEYEELVRNPDRYFRNLSNFLGVPFDQAMISGIVQTSIKKNRTPDISAQIRADCEEVFDRLRSAARKQAWVSDD